MQTIPRVVTYDNASATLLFSPVEEIAALRSATLFDDSVDLSAHLTSQTVWPPALLQCFSFCPTTQALQHLSSVLVFLFICHHLKLLAFYKLSSLCVVGCGKEVDRYQRVEYCKNLYIMLYID